MQRKKQSREEVSVVESIPMSTPTKADQTAKMSARTRAPSTGGVRPHVVDSPASVR